MPALDDTVSKLQLALANQDSDFEPVIRAAVLDVWELVAKYRRWAFLRGAQYRLDLLATVSRYQIQQSLLEQFLYISSSAGRRIMVYKTPDDFELIRSGSPAVGGNTGSNETANSYPQIFTEVGKESGNWTLEIYPTPAQNQTVYLQWLEGGVEANYDKLPRGWHKVIQHGVRSTIAKPVKIEENVWRSLTYREDQMFIYWLTEMARLEKVVPATRSEVEYDAVIADRLADACL